MLCFKVYRCRSLALAFLELTVVRRFHEYVHQPSVPPPLRAVLQRLSALYALWSLNQHTALLYRGEAPRPPLSPPPRPGVQPVLSGGLCLLVLSGPHRLREPVGR